ncbi:MAG: DUF2927 domain-containing protein [Paracoccaceae bacterium]
MGKSWQNNQIKDSKQISPQELKLRKYYSRVEARKLSMGLLRQDGGGADTPFDLDDIIEVFEKLAFYNEYNIDDNQLLPNSNPVSLGKWKTQVNISPRFGDSVSIKQKAQDTIEIANLLSVLSDATNHKIKLTDKNTNMYIVIGNQKEIVELTNEISLDLNEFDPKRIPIITKLPRDIHCMAMTSVSSHQNSEIESALVIIRNELPDLMRRACFHEEIAQSLGLTNDSHLARPSIFNDDDEFSTLTKLDKILLNILYDNRLKSGIVRNEASQLVRQIASEVTAQD